MLPPCSAFWREVPVLPEKFQEYLHTVEEQICWARAKAPLTTELRTHLLEQYDDCRSQGLDEDAALDETLRQMGDPIAVGQELDRVHRPQPQWGLLCLTGVLVVAGSILRAYLTTDAGMPYLAGSALSENLTAAILGIACMFSLYFLDYGLLGRYAKPIYFGTLFLSLVSLDCSPYINNASYSTRYMVLCFPVVYALWVYSLRGKGWSGLVWALIGGVPLIVIALCTPYLLGCFLLLLSDFAVLLAAIWKGSFRVDRKIAAGAVSGFALAAAGGVCWASRRTIHNRLLYMLHPELDPLGSGYQALVLREALAGAQSWGEGTLSGPRAGYDYWRVVPEGDTDCFLTTVIYHLGWVPFFLLCGALLLLLVWALVKCLRQKNVLGRLLSIAILLTFGLQFAASVLLNLGFVFTSATCPFLIGNLHTVLDMALVGIMLSVFRQEHLPTASLTQLPSRPAKWPRYTISVSIKRVE